MRRAWRAAGWAAVAALALWPADAGHAHGPRVFDAGRAPELLARRLLGPFASLAASVQWTRVDADLGAGRLARAYARAETALALDPRATAGWSFLAHHLVYSRARPELESDPLAREAHLRAGIALLARGEELADDPGKLAFEAGLALVHATAYSDARAWPGGAAGAWEEAALHFERASRLGHPLGAEAAELSHERAREARSNAPDSGREADERR